MSSTETSTTLKTHFVQICFARSQYRADNVPVRAVRLPQLSVNLVERSSISETTIPNLVDYSCCLHVILARWSVADGYRCSPPDAVL